MVKLMKLLTNKALIKFLRLLAPWVAKKEGAAAAAQLPFQTSMGPTLSF